MLNACVWLRVRECSWSESVARHKWFHFKSVWTLEGYVFISLLGPSVKIGRVEEMGLMLKWIGNVWPASLDV